jgi:hypothetical protein
VSLDATPVVGLSLYHDRFEELRARLQFVTHFEAFPFEAQVIKQLVDRLEENGLESVPSGELTFIAYGALS